MFSRDGGGEVANCNHSVIIQLDSPAQYQHPAHHMSMFENLGGSSSYDMPDDYVAGDLDAPPALRSLRASGAAVVVECVEGGAGAGVSCTAELVVDGIAPESASQQAGVQLGMRLVALETGGGEDASWGAWQGKPMTWDGVYDIVSSAPRPWRFTFAPPELDAEPEPTPAAEAPVKKANEEPAAAARPMTPREPTAAELEQAAVLALKAREARLAALTATEREEEKAETSRIPTEAEFEALLLHIEETVLKGDEMKESRDGTFARLRKEWEMPPLALLSAALPAGWEGEEVCAYAAKAGEETKAMQGRSAAELEAGLEEGERNMQAIVGAARRVLFFPSGEVCFNAGFTLVLRCFYAVSILCLC